MREGTKTALLEKGRPDEGFVKEAVAAVKGAPHAERVRVGLKALIAMAEVDPVQARSALFQLRTNHLRLARLEAWLGGDPDRTTFALGAAIQLVYAELSTEEPNLAAIEPDLLRWLEGEW